jgi:hypothetical protein
MPSLAGTSMRRFLVRGSDSQSPERARLHPSGWDGGGNETCCELDRRPGVWSWPDSALTRREVGQLGFRTWLQDGARVQVLAPCRKPLGSCGVTLMTRIIEYHDHVPAWRHSPAPRARGPVHQAFSGCCPPFRVLLRLHKGPTRRHRDTRPPRAARPTVLLEGDLASQLLKRLPELPLARFPQDRVSHVPGCSGG